MSFKDNIISFYDNAYIQHIQFAAPIALRMALNYSSGQSLSNGMSIAAPLSFWMYLSHFAGTSRDWKYQYIWSSARYQLTSCLLYSFFSSFGYNPTVTKLFAKLATTLIYGSPVQKSVIYSFTERYDLGYAIQSTTSDLLSFALEYTKLNSIVGDSWIVQSSLSCTLRFAINKCFSGLLGNYDKTKDTDEPEINRFLGCTASNIITQLIPTESSCRILEYTLPEKALSFARSYVEGFTQYNQITL